MALLTPTVLGSFVSTLMNKGYILLEVVCQSASDTVTVPSAWPSVSIATHSPTDTAIYNSSGTTTTLSYAAPTVTITGAAANDIVAFVVSTTPSAVNQNNWEV